MKLIKQLVHVVCSVIALNSVSGLTLASAQQDNSINDNLITQCVGLDNTNQLVCEGNNSDWFDDTFDQMGNSNNGYLELDCASVEFYLFNSSLFSGLRRLCPWFFKEEYKKALGLLGANSKSASTEIKHLKKIDNICINFTLWRDDFSVLNDVLNLIDKAINTQQINKIVILNDSPDINYERYSSMINNLCKFCDQFYQIVEILFFNKPHSFSVCEQMFIHSKSNVETIERELIKTRQEYEEIKIDLNNTKLEFYKAIEKFNSLYSKSNSKYYAHMIDLNKLNQDIRKSQQERDIAKRKMMRNTGRFIKIIDRISKLEMSRREFVERLNVDQKNWDEKRKIVDEYKKEIAEARNKAAEELKKMINDKKFNTFSIPINA